MNEQQLKEFDLMKEAIVTQAKFNNQILDLVNKLFNIIESHQVSLTEISVDKFREQIDKLEVCGGCSGKHCACKEGN